MSDSDDVSRNVEMLERDVLIEYRNKAIASVIQLQNMKKDQMMADYLKKVTISRDKFATAGDKIKDS